jgi:hypothetical protein
VSAYAMAYRDAALAMRQASARFWTAFHPHREVSTTLGISAAIHLIILLGITSAIYDSGTDDADVPELSVQLVTREGPNDQEFTEAALPQPAPEPAENAIDDPGTGDRTLDAPALATSSPQPEEVLAADGFEAAAPSEPTSVAAAVLTTTADSPSVVPAVAEPDPKGAAEVVSEPDQAMLARNVQEVAKKLLETNTTTTSVSWQQDGQQYSARVIRQPAADSTGLEQVIAEIMTNKDGKRMKTHLSLKRLAFSHFTQLVNNWDKTTLLHDDVIDGRFHSNSEISLSAMNGVKPRFFGKVTTAAQKVTYDNFSPRRNQDVFQGGFETKTDRVTLPRDMPDVVNGGEQLDRRAFSEDTRIMFNADGSYGWRLANGSGANQLAPASEHPQYLIADKGVKLYVRGTVRGIFTVYSPSDIEIEDDIVYLKDPRQTVISRDFLALIAGRDIKVSPTEVTGPGDLTVHAALFARQRFYVEGIDHGKSATMFLYGSLTAGSISATEPRYATKIDYDKRFEYLRPASFPMTHRYEVDSWDKDWEEVEGPETPTGELARSQ